MRPKFKVGDVVRCLEEDSYGLTIHRAGDVLMVTRAPHAGWFEAGTFRGFNHCWTLTGRPAATDLAAETAIRHDSSKPQVSLIPSSAILAEAEVFTFGATKYAADNWRKGMEYRRVINSAMRHLLSIANGEDVDEESGKLHAAHVRANMAFLIEYRRTNTGTDDRFQGTLG